MDFAGTDGRRASILREMGLGPIWRLREVSVAVATPAAEQVAQVDSVAPSRTEGTPVPVAASTSAPVRKMPPASPEAPPSPVTPALSADERTRAIAAMGWEELHAAVAGCRSCELCRERKQAVFGVGDPAADWLMVGEGPGAEEDQRGEPFVGQAGKLLDAMLAAIGLRRGENVYIANAVKCRPPSNRTPHPDEMAACRPFLERQIELIGPKLIVALGRPAAQTLLQSEIKISAARGKLHRYLERPVIVTYHPAYLLRTLADKAKAWQDLCFARRTFRSLSQEESANL